MSAASTRGKAIGGGGEDSVTSSVRPGLAGRPNKVGYGVCMLERRNSERLRWVFPFADGRNSLISDLTRASQGDPMCSRCFVARMFCIVATLSMFAAMANATSSSYEGGALPQAYIDRLAAYPQAFQFQRALISVTERAAVVRQLLSQPELSGLAADSSLSRSLSSALGATNGNPPPRRVQGRRNIPVVLLDFPDSGPRRFTPAQLKTELFDGPWPSGTLTQYYSEISNGALDVRGAVTPWLKLSKPAAFYAGADYVDSSGKTQHCYGLCPQKSKIGDLIREAIDGNKAIDWGAYNNNGPDGLPNSGDDNGFVDFVAFVHAGRGGECGGAGNANIWSHRGSLSETLGLPPYVTKSRRAGGGFIKIDDYVVLPALACDGTTMIPIGVIAHEFGHAFGLPDLYDTKGSSAGLGNWDLMATGAWGGNGVSPETPSHMSAWSKQFLGWIDVKDVVGEQRIEMKPIEKSHTAFKVKISNSSYYLISVTDRSGFDANLPMSGLVVLLVNESVLSNGLRSNTVNSDVKNMGIKLIEADGLERLNAEPFRGGASDLFPGPEVRRSFDATTTPSVLGKMAICGISDPGNPMSVTIAVGEDRCAAIETGAADATLAQSLLPSEVPAAAPPAGVASGAAVLVEGSSVVMRGMLINAGTNYFDRKSRRIVLIDEKGEEVDVSTTLPLADAPAGARPPGGVLSDFLDKKIEVRGVVEKRPTDGTPLSVRATEMRIIN